MKNVIITGASGMVGSILLEACLTSSEIGEVTSLVRKKTDNKNPKLKEVIINDFTNYSTQTHLFENIDIAFFCIGVYTGQVPDDKFKEITVDYAVTFSETLKTHSPQARLCFLSGAGADRTEKSGTSFAKYKGIAENKISEIGLKFHAFRPGYIYPVTPRKEPNIMYKTIRLLYPLIRLTGSNGSIKSTELAKAMFNVGLNGAETEVLENSAILKHL